MSLSRKEHLSPFDLQYTINWWRQGGNFNLDHYERVLANRMAPPEIIGWDADAEFDFPPEAPIKIKVHIMVKKHPRGFYEIADPKDISFLMESNKRSYRVLKANPIYK